ADPRLMDLGRVGGEGRRRVGPATVRFCDELERSPLSGIKTRFGCSFTLLLEDGSLYPELLRRTACRERVEPHVGSFTPGTTMTRYYHSVILPEGAHA